MTNREFLNIVLSANISEDANAKATALLEALDKRNAQRSSKPSKRSIENQPIKEAILKFLGESTPATASDIAKACELKVQKASGVCIQMEKEGVLVSEWVKLPKKGQTKVYRLA